MKILLSLLLTFMLINTNAQEKHFISTKIINEKSEQIDSLINIKLKNPVITIGENIYIAEKRKVYYSVEEYMVYDEYTVDEITITFYIHPDDGDIVMVALKKENTICFK